MESKYKYGCVLGELESQPYNIKLINPSDLMEVNGKTVEPYPHVTILYGLHREVSINEVKEIVRKIHPFEISLVSVSSFEQEDHDVLKWDVQSRTLNRLNRDLCELPYTTDFPNYEPHVTIAFLKPGAGKKYNKKVNPIRIRVKFIEFTKANGLKWVYKLI